MISDSRTRARWATPALRSVVVGFTQEAKDKLHEAFWSRPIWKMRCRTICSSWAATLAFSPTWATTVFKMSLAWSGIAAWTRISATSKAASCRSRRLQGYTFPDPLDPRFFADIPERIARYGDRFRVFSDRLFALRAGLDAARDAEPVDGFLRPSRISSTTCSNAIADYNIAQVRRGPEIRH